MSMTGNHFLLTLTDFQRSRDPNSPTQYGSFKFRANWENETVEVTKDTQGTEGRLPYTNDPNNPYNEGGTQDPGEYNNVPLYIDGDKYLAHSIKYENSGNQAPYFTAGGGTGYFLLLLRMASGSLFVAEMKAGNSRSCARHPVVLKNC